MKIQKEIRKFTYNIQLPRNNKIYWENQFDKFSRLFINDKIKFIQFGKQDSRGTESITFVDAQHRVPFQRLFENKWEMLGYIQAVNELQNGYTEIHDYMVTQ